MTQKLGPNQGRPGGVGSFPEGSSPEVKMADAIGAEDFDNYTQVKREILATCGTTPSSAWCDMHEEKQGQEAFCQFTLRVGRPVKRWVELVASSSALKEKVSEAMLSSSSWQPP